MKNVDYRHIVETILHKVVVNLGATGEKGRLITIFIGASADFGTAVAQIKGLIIDGYAIETVFSAAGHDLYGDTLKDMLTGFPNVSDIDDGKWLKATDDAVAVVVPMLSLNTLSRIALLMADNMPTNIILRALFTGVPVIMAQNGALPDAGHWRGKSNAAQSPQPPALQMAVAERLRKFVDYGGYAIDVGAIRKTVTGVHEGVHEKVGQDQGHEADYAPTRKTIQPETKTITASQIRMAHAAKADLLIPGDAKITPLAQDLAGSLGVKMLLNRVPS